MYAETREEWRAVLDGLHRAADRGDAVGLDTEFYGHDWATGTRFDYDPRDITPIGRTHVHVWSVAVLTHRTTARGHRKAVPAVLPAESLDDPGIRAWLESPAVKCVHNLPADAHTLANHGIDLAGGRDTLAVARWCWPERTAMSRKFRPYALKTLATELLGYTDVVSFQDLLTEPNVVPVVKTVSRCVCSLEGCRKRKDPHGQYKVEVTDYVERGRKPIPLWSLTPHSAVWADYVSYAASDAVWTVELADLAMKTSQEIPRLWAAK